MAFYNFLNWDKWLGDPRRVFDAHLQLHSWKELLKAVTPLTGKTDSVPGYLFKQADKTIILSHPVDAIPLEADRTHASNKRFELSGALTTFAPYIKTSGITEIIIPIIDRKKNLRFISEAEHDKLLHLKFEVTFVQGVEYKTIHAKYYDPKPDFNNLIFPSTAQEATVKNHFGKNADWKDANVDWKDENIDIQAQFNSSDCGEIVSRWCYDLIEGNDITRTALSEDEIKLNWIEATLNSILAVAKDADSSRKKNQKASTIEGEDAEDFHPGAEDEEEQPLDAKKIEKLYKELKAADNAHFLKSPAINVLYEILIEKNIGASEKNQLIDDTDKIFSGKASVDEIKNYIEKTKPHQKNVSVHWGVKLCNSLLVLCGLALMGLAIAAAIPSAGLSLAVFAGAMKVIYAGIAVFTTAGIASTGISTCVAYHRSSQNIAHTAKECADIALEKNHYKAAL